MTTSTSTEPRIKYPAQQVQLLVTFQADPTAQSLVIKAAQSMGFQVQWVAAELVDVRKGERSIFTEECFDRLYEEVKVHANELIASGEVEFPCGHWPMTPPVEWSAEEKRRLIKLAVDWFGFGHSDRFDVAALANSMRWGQLNI